jgi:hypothetical protein
MADSKPQMQSDFEEFDAPPTHSQQRPASMARTADAAHVGLTALALLSALVIVGTSAETLATFNSTYLGKEYYLPLWPTDFDLRPTTALVACGTIIIVTSAVSLATSMVPAVSYPIQLLVRAVTDITT